MKPRVLRDVSGVSLATTVLGRPAALPFGIAPTAMQRLAHPQGEVANVKAAQEKGALFCLSTLSTSSVEEVGAAAPNARKWFQLYIYKDRNVTRQLVQRAQAAGFEALVLTVDAPIFGIRYADTRNNFSLPPHLEYDTHYDLPLYYPFLTNENIFVKGWPILKALLEVT